VRPVLLLYALALLVRLGLIALFPDPAYADSYYYVDVARSLATTGRFEVDFIWIFPEVGGAIPADPVLPIPSNAHWMPLASLVQLPFIAILGPSAVASALPFALIGATAAPLTWAIARDAGARAPVPIASGILTAVPLLSLVYLVQPDNFSLFQPLVAGALWLGARGMRGDGRAFAVAGLLAGIAMLSRNDGLLVLAALGLVFAWNRLRAMRPSSGEAPGRPIIPLWSAVACVALFALVVAPWFARQLAEFGSLSPSAATGKVLYIRSMAEWNSISTPASLEHLLGQGAGPLLASRLGGLVAAVSIFSTLVCGVLLVPFLVLGAWRWRGSRDFRPFFVYGALLFAFSALVSAVHVPGGTFIHSAVALAPHSYILAVEGILVAVGWAAARRRTWHAGTAGPFFVTAAIAFAVLTSAAGALLVHARWTQEREQRLAVAAALDAAAAPRSDRVMSIDASGYRYYTGRGGVVLVNDPLPTVEQVAEAYGIRWLVLERDDAVTAVAPILAGDRPEWVGPPILTLPGPAGTTAVAVYPVCTTQGDDRCTEGAS
jgi:hypothetical protein